jgi:hypothetical protein
MEYMIGIPIYCGFEFPARTEFVLNGTTSGQSNPASDARRELLSGNREAG